MTQIPPGLWKLVGLSGASADCCSSGSDQGIGDITFPTRLNLLIILVALAAILLMAFDEEHNEASPKSARLEK